MANAYEFINNVGGSKVISAQWIDHEGTWIDIIVDGRWCNHLVPIGGMNFKKHSQK